jgi:hypothetical protein
MATTAAPHGASVVGSSSVKGSFNGGDFKHYKIASAYATAIFAGDFVKAVSDGSVAKDTGTTTLTPCGIFVGCEYTNSQGQKIQDVQWPAGQVAADAVAYIVTDPDVEFIMQADEAIAQTGLFNNVAIVQTAGSTAFGRSKNAVDGGSIATTNTLPLRIVGFVDGPYSAVNDTYTDVVVRFNAGHTLRQVLGI